ncbi:MULTISPECIES: nucleotidyltransferase family protein [Frankia]|uniref:nucleotidyltransferase family protein n=1 Tax=Frankia TaxID=1854 RepID=UPI002101CA1E|nr:MULTISPECIES: nucleotidyltransferase domain-containing protein [Frankia]
MFGSQTRGTATADSDIDILYTLQPGRRLGWDIEQLADDPAGLFGRPVDLISVGGLHPSLRSSVLAEARPMYAA